MQGSHACQAFRAEMSGWDDIETFISGVDR
jgi:hypothetical protein